MFGRYRLSTESLFFQVLVFLVVARNTSAFQFSGKDISPLARNRHHISGPRYAVTHSKLYSSTPLGNEDKGEITEKGEETKKTDSSLGMRLAQVFQQDDKYKKLPPLKVEDLNILLYDVFLIVNLSLSISFWVTHRMDFAFLPAAINEGCLFAIFWILSGLYHGAFLMSAVDGHYGSTDERGGPKAAAALALNTYISATNMRLVFALVSAVLQHRQVGVSTIEELIPLEIGCGIALMALWRALHSFVTPRI